MIRRSAPGKGSLAGSGPATVPVAHEVIAEDLQADVEVDVQRWVALAQAVLVDIGLPAQSQLDLTFVDAAAMAELNHDHMGATGPTDVLAFPLDGEDTGPTPPGMPRLLGDVIICPAVAAANAPDHAGTLEDELALLVVHGILHVLGMDHVTDEETTAMQAREQELLERHHRNPA